jgi:hypothetical protein
MAYVLDIIQNTGLVNVITTVHRPASFLHVRSPIPLYLHLQQNRMVCGNLRPKFNGLALISKGNFLLFAFACSVRLLSSAFACSSYLSPLVFCVWHAACGMQPSSTHKKCIN